jgi:uncharacterized protein
MAAPKLRDVRKLADSRAVFDLDVALNELTDFPADLVAAGGSVHAHIVFGREQGYAIARLELQASLQMTCQRCLAPMPVRVETSSPVLIVESEQEAEGAPAGWETFLAPEGRFVFEALIAEELLLALPIVPSHAEAAQCVPTTLYAGDAGANAGSADVAANRVSPPAAQAPTVRPFADLRALLDRSTKSGDREPK